ncbi:MAG: HlyC/CorC family transporter [Anaerolineae bacterium]|nr:MAG: HlyC/CorC family transporter [Anaerolineae bacterium]
MIEIESGLPLLIAFFLLDLLIAATRAALLNARPLRLMPLREEQPQATERALALLDSLYLRPTLRLSQVLARVSLLGLSFLLIASVIGERPLLRVFQFLGTLGVALALLVAEFLVEGRIVRRPEEWALRLAPWGRFLTTLFVPLTFLPVLLTRAYWPSQATVQVTDDELRSWVESEEDTGGLEREERQMIYSIFRFGETLAREIMVPRIDMLALEVHTPLSEAVDAFIRSGYSRVPVYEGTVDNVLGLLYAKDLLQSINGKRSLTLRDLLRPAYFVPETKKADELLAEMQAQRIHMAIVVDEYGGVSGLVTLEDIIEEIIGEIQDEYDQSEEVPYQAVGPDEYIFHGRIDLDDFNQIMKSDLPKDEADTLAGFLYDRMGRVPQAGEKIQEGDLELTVEQIIGRRIRRVRARRIAASEEKTKKNEHAF